jgi:hypothetical protein
MNRNLIDCLWFVTVRSTVHIYALESKNVRFFINLMLAKFCAQTRYMLALYLVAETIFELNWNREHFDHDWAIYHHF